MNTATLAPVGHYCDDCHAEAEKVPASYVLSDGALVCDTHLEIRAEA